ncbi:MAG: toll/interleukin-1 receptor domain-containing protein [Gracilibacteraceae bacterium]|nr:toll/interleukin-1 receptor domain-containing protein [Gracilibacteraceae bacterium]
MDFQYEAFISYRHKELDTQAAKAVHRALETFRLPARLRPDGKKRIGKIFRDQDELPLMPNLDDGIKRALDGSRWLIVVCTPDLPQSKWCMAEVDHFIATGRRDRILTLLAAGEPDESFPPQLRFLPDENGGMRELEPLAADLRAPTVRAMRRKLRVEKLRLLAPMLGVGFDDLRRRERERFLRRLISVSLAAALFFALFGGYALSQALTIERQNAELTEQKAKVYANFSLAELERGNRAGAALLALETLPPDGQNPPGPAARAAVYGAACREYGRILPLAQMPSGPEITPAPDGKTFTASDGEYTRVYDTETFRLIYEHPGALTSVAAFQTGGLSAAQTRRPVYDRAGGVVFLPNGSPVFVDVRTGQAVREGYFTDAAELADFGFSRYTYEAPRQNVRRVVDLAGGNILFEAPARYDTSKNIFSPDGKYFAVAAYDGLDLFSVERGELAASVPCDGLYALQGYIFFSPDSRFLVLTREKQDTVPYGAFEEQKTVYIIQILEIPSCRIVYENEFPGHPRLDGVIPSGALPNYGHVYESDAPAWLFAPDGGKLLLPVGTEKYGVFDLAREEMLFTVSESLRFASFSPSGRLILTIDQRGITWKLRDAATGETLVRSYDENTAFLRGFVLPDDKTVLLAGSAADGGFCGLYEATVEETGEPGVYFADESGRYVRPAAAIAADDADAAADDAVAAAAVVDGRSGETLAVLADSADFTGADFAAAGDIVLGLSDAGTQSGLRTWNAGAGEVLAPVLPLPENCFVARNYYSPSFFLAADGSRAAVIYQRFGIMSGGFRLFDPRTGELLADGSLGWLGEIAFDRNLTKVLSVYDNQVSLFDALSGEKLFTLADYPAGDLAVGVWSGQRAALSGDGSWLAVSHSKKNTLEIIETERGRRLHEVGLDGQATTAPFFAPEGERVAVGAGQRLLCLETASGKEVFSVYDEAGFERDWAFSADGLYLLGTEIRAAATGEVLCPVPLTPRPRWEITGAAGVTVPVGGGRAVYLPALSEALTELRGLIRQYDFTRGEKQRLALD